MNTTLWLRIAAAISLLFTAGHTLGGLTDWSPMGDNDVLKAMKAVHFDTMGASRSYHDFFIGFGYSISVSMLLATVASGLVAWRFIFPVPALFALALLACLVLAFVSSR